jgi:protein TIF31
MVVVSYRGYKIIAQGIIPGILSVDQINCSQYGSLDDGKTIETNPDFEKLMLQVCEKLGLYDKVQVTDGQGEVKTIAGSPDIKGILGTDQRKYILDLLRLSPRDLNYEGP